MRKETHSQASFTTARGLDADVTLENMCHSSLLSLTSFSASQVDSASFIQGRLQQMRKENSQPGQLGDSTRLGS